MREHLKRASERGQVSRIRRAVCNPRDQPFQIIDRREILADLFPGDGCILELRHGVQALFNFLLVNKRLFHIFSESSCSHGGLCLVQHPQQGASFLFLSQRLAQLQIPPCGAVEHHVFPCRVRSDMCQVGQRVFLRLKKILKKRACTDDPAVIIRQPQSRKR